MGKINKQNKVKLVIGFIFSQKAVYEKTKDILQKRLGRIDFESDLLEFNHTDYYEKEFGRDLKRGFIAFKKLILPNDISKIKVMTNKVEEKLAYQGLRRINIDPGYLDLSKLVLASTKDYKHRIYQDKGIYAEVTLYYQNKSFNAWEWTYPDYKTAEYIAIFNRLREIYAQQIKIN